ncbi:MAG: alpha/beta fold hydrolase [Chlamydiia bacterium]|nr:alpha/beta fold hydrolase [Chlamydiia bacterium]
MSQELPFDPFPFLQDPHHQTLINTFLNFLFEPDSEQKLVTLSDGDKLSLEVTTPKDWRETDPTVILVHGLCGSHKSPNLVRMARRLEPLGIRAVRYNMRGCGSGRGLSRQIYHSGRSEDVFEAIKAMKKEAPASPITLIGFSLGGNIVLKMAGELASLGPTFVKKTIAVSPPVDLYSSILMLGREENAMYEKYFYRLLRADVHYRHKKFRDLPPIRLPHSLKLYEFDQIYTAPYCGFRNVQDYYNRCSAASVVPDIAMPCRILFAEDDPIVSCKSLDAYKLPSHIQLLKTRKGGHMGYLGDPRDKNGIHWLDSVLVEWIQGNDSL